MLPSPSLPLPPLPFGRFGYGFTPASADLVTLDRIKIPISELNLPDHAHVAVYLALDLILKHAAGLGQLAHHDEDLAAVDELAVLGTKRDPLTDDELVYWHLRYLGRPALLLALRGFFAVPRLLPPFGATWS